MRLLALFTTLGVIGVAAAAFGVLLVRRPVLFSTLFAEGGVSVETGIAYGPEPRHRLDIYRPQGAGASGPIAIFIYGGSWRTGERATFAFVGAALARRGITTVIPDYRLFPQTAFPGFVEDAARAYAWTYRNLARAAGRPIVLVGHSAGAHIAALLALDTHYLAAQGEAVARPAAFIGLAGPYAFDPTTWPTTRDIFAAAPNADTARPVAFANAGAPPSLLMHGLADKVVKLYNLHDLADALRAKGASAEIDEFAGIGHLGILLAMAWPFRWRAPVLDKTVDFIRDHAGAQARSEVSDHAARQ
jgi:acetyl esterase/lipase